MTNSLVSNFTGSFRNGFTVKNIPINLMQNEHRKFWHVDYTYGSNAADGSVRQPFQTLVYALTRVNEGDVIVLASNHNETITSEIDVNIAGIQILGQGEREAIPMLTFADDISARLLFNADNIYFNNIACKCDVAGAVLVRIKGKNCTVENCYFTEGTAEAANFVTLGYGDANSADGSQVLNCRFYAPIVGSYNGISFSSAGKNLVIAHNQMYGSFSQAGIYLATHVIDGLIIINNIIHNINAAGHAIELTSSSTGDCTDNRLYASELIKTLDADSLLCAGNLGSTQVGETGTPVPITGDLSGDISRGSVFTIEKTVVSSAITFASPVDITGVSSNGELEVVQVILKTDSTGLAGGTNFELKSDNARGAANILVDTVANLGANVTVALEDASIAGTPTIIEIGKKLQVQSTVADCTGAGEIDIYVTLRRLSAGATISAV